MTPHAKIAETRMQTLRDAFEGLRGRQPATQQELNDWLTSEEGKQATLFNAAEVYMWGEMRAGGVRDSADDEKFRSDLLHE